MRIHDHNKIFKKKNPSRCVNIFLYRSIFGKNDTTFTSLWFVYIVNHGVLTCHSRAMQSRCRATLLITDRSRERLIFHWEYYHRSFKLQIVIEI